MEKMREVLGLGFDDQRMEAIMELYRPILYEIAKLRDLDLKDMYPATHFDPTTHYHQKLESDPRP